MVRHTSFNEGALEHAAERLQDNDVISRIAAEINEHSPTFRIARLSEMLGSSLSQTTTFLNLLSMIVHNYGSHHEDFVDTLAQASEPTRDKINLFVSSLDEDGQHAFQLQFFTDSQLKSEPESLGSITTELSLVHVRDGSDNILGMCPFVKLKIRTNDDTSDDFKLHVPLHTLETIIQILRQTQDQHADYVEKYKAEHDTDILMHEK